MNENYINKISNELNIGFKQVSATSKLLSEDATIPFIARYRKEMTGSLDEVVLTTIRDRLNQLEVLDNRRNSILKSLQERDLLTDDLNKAIGIAETIVALEDIYLPYKPKRRTKATKAREKGLEPLAEIIFKQTPEVDPEKESQNYINSEKGVTSIEDAISGARDIIIEWISEDADTRKDLRELFEKKAFFKSKVVIDQETAGAKYLDYFDFTQICSKTPSHRVLAMFRGEKEGYLRLNAKPEKDDAIALIQKHHLKGDNLSAAQVKKAISDCYTRSLSISMETELRNNLKTIADTDAINVFAENIRELLMAPPLGQKSVLAIDPGFRTGCKVVCLDPQGKLLDNTTIFIAMSQNQADNAKSVILNLIEKYKIATIAIGNGTASRETESFVKTLALPKSFPVVMVNESGASIYSASEVARQEFPDKDVTVRGSVSIGRRLMDPLAELVKIDPKSIGVGQYQHDVDQTNLKESLDEVVASCVNKVGVEVNTASKELLTYVSGLSASLAKNIVDYRNENGPINSRKDLLKIPRLGPKAFEQAAGFLRIQESNNYLDKSAVHPESYPIVKKMAQDLKTTVDQLMKNAGLRKNIELKNYITEKTGMPTLVDILEELDKPGRDPRGKFEAFSFAEGVNEIADLASGMKLPGIVTNVTNFGAFVDIGVHQDGLVHISQLADKFVKDPKDIVKVAQVVNVTVIDVDVNRKRISLSLRKKH